MLLASQPLLAHDQVPFIINILYKRLRQDVRCLNSIYRNYQVILVNFSIVYNMNEFVCKIPDVAP